MRQEEGTRWATSRNLERRDLGINRGRIQEFVRIDCNKPLTPVGKFNLQTENRTGNLPTKKQQCLSRICESKWNGLFSSRKKFRCFWKRKWDSLAL